MYKLDVQLPTPEEAAVAKHSSQTLSTLIETNLETQSFSISDSEGVAQAINMPVFALRMLMNALSEIGEGNTVKMVPIHAELTTQECADMLNISRPTFVKLLNDGTIPHKKSGNRRKVRYTDIQSYKDTLESARLETLGKLSALDQELGLG